MTGIGFVWTDPRQWDLQNGATLPYVSPLGLVFLCLAAVQMLLFLALGASTVLLAFRLLNRD